MIVFIDLIFIQLHFDILNAFFYRASKKETSRKVLKLIKKIFNVIYTFIIESAAKGDVKANLSDELIEMLDEAYFIFHKIFMSKYYEPPQSEKYEEVKKILGFKMI